MRHRYLGKSGLLVSELSLGTMTFGAPGWGCGKAEAQAIIAAYLEAGGNHLDTADVYAKGESEAIIGDFMPSMRRDELVLASKCGFPLGADPNGLGASRKHIVRSVEASLKRLRTDYLDIYYIHRSDPFSAVEEIAETLDILIRQGKILHAAFSNLPAWRLTLANGAAKLRGMSGLLCGQYLYNLVDRSCEQEIIPAMRHQGIGFLAWSPLAGGLLTGKYNESAEVPKESRFDLRRALDIPRFWSERKRRVASEFCALAGEAGIPPNRLAIAWLLSKDYVSSVLLGARTREQAVENFAASGLDLPQDLVRRLDALSEPDKNYLWSFNEETNAQFTARGRLSPGAVLS